MTAQIAHLPSRGRRMLPFVSLALYLWTQYRWAFAFAAAPWLVSAAVDHFLYAGQIPTLAQCGKMQSVTIFIFPAMLILSPLVLLARMDDSLWLLPIRTRMLVGWAMSIGASTIALFWIATALCIWRPAGLDTPLWWPAAALAALFATVFTAASRPDVLSRRDAAASVLLAIVIAALLLVKGHAVWRTIVEFSSQTPESVLWAGYLTVAFLFFPVATARAQNARMGEIKTEVDVPNSKAHTSPAKFRTPEQAQLWCEWRTRKWAIIGHVLTPGAMALLFPIILQIVHDTSAGPNYWGMYGFSSIDWYGFGISVTTIVFLSGLAGAFAPRMLRRRDVTVNSVRWKFNNADIRVSPFVSVRPFDAASYVAIHLRIIAWSVVGVWIALLPAAAVWLMTPTIMHSAATTQGQAFIAVLGASKNGAMLLFYIAVLAGSIFLSWAIPAEMLFLSLTGRWGIVVGGYYTAKITILIAAGGVLLIANNSAHAALSIACCAVVVVCLKALLTLQATRRLRKRSLISALTMRKVSAAWAGAATVFFLLFCVALVPQGISWPQILLAILFLMPGPGLALVPLAFSWDRNR
ncbi:MAG: hypothetical protein ABIY70_06400 [Capsulimonas sp.]|uniref:hypothetical protein n=1 Tax=Capsulimonas sp. TaxID=2494211 RepID=UPI003264B2F1